MTNSPVPPHTRRSPETWEAARRDYMAGASTAVIGERYGIDARSVRRRARLEQWRRDDAPVPTFDPLRFRMESDLETFPELAEVSAIASRDLHDLLLLPDSIGLCRYAFRKAAESAAMGAPGEAASWLRVVRLSETVGSRIDVDVRPYSPADYLRASMIEALAAEGDIDAMELDEESDVSAMSPEISGGPDSGG
ncbi:MAG: hypothetical protein ACXW3K_10395 [Brevundimonas sp.]